jgi:MerR family transcriptional regulator, copper efflux regulator
MSMSIGALAQAAGVNVPTVRYYERRGIIPQPPRTSSGYRRYDQNVLDRIRFIKRAQELGFSLEEIGDLLALRVDDRRTCRAVEAATRAKLADVQAKIRDLQRLRNVLTRLVRSCQEKTPTNECPILAVLEQRRAE